jgi:hypothetical protein
MALLDADLDNRPLHEGLEPELLDFDFLDAVDVAARRNRERGEREK